MAEPILTTRDLIVGRKGRIQIQTTDVSITSGQIWAVLGPNGGGKSTLLDTFAGLIPPVGGSIQINGHEFGTMAAKDQARLIASVGQNEKTPDGFSIRDVAVMGRIVQGTGYWESPEDWDAADTHLRRLGLTSLASRPSEQTSGGEFQRALIARALTSSARLVLLDEPTSSIDSEHLQNLGEVFLEEAAQQRAIVVSTHNFEWAATFADHFLIVDEGRARVAGDRSDLEAWMKTRFSDRASFLADSQGNWTLSMGYQRPSPSMAAHEKAPRD